MLPTLLSTALPRVILVTGTAADPLRDAALTAIVDTVAARGTTVARGEVGAGVGAAAFVHEVEHQQEDAHLLVLDGGPLLAPREGGATLADLATALRYKGISVGAVVVTGVSVGAINHVALNVEALRTRQIGIVGVVVAASMPADAAGAASLVQSLPSVGGTFLGVVEV